MKDAEAKVAEAEKKVNDAKTNLQNARTELAQQKEAYEAVKGQIAEQSQDLSQKLEKALEDLEDGKEGTQTAAAGQNAKNSKLSSIFNLGQNALNGAGQLASMFAQKQAEGETTNTNKRPLNSQEIAAVNNELMKSYNLAKQIDANGGILKLNLPFTNQTTDSDNTTSTSNTANTKTTTAATTTTTASNTAATAANNSTNTTNPFVLTKKSV